MRVFPLLALVGMAVANNSTYSWSKPPPQPTKQPQTPDRRGKPKYVGCYESSAGFSSFTFVGSSTQMSAELCAVSCPSRLLGLYNT